MVAALASRELGEPVNRERVQRIMRAHKRRHLSARGITHRRGGYRDPESQAFIESWFGQFKRRCAWRCEWETIDQACREISTYIDSYHHRPQSGIGYRIPAEVAATWQDPMQDPTVIKTPAT